MSNVLEINNVSKIFPNKTEALKDFCLEIKEGEIFALLGPNGAGKTTLISSICGISKPSAGSIKVKGFDTILEYKKARKEIGLVPQELTLESFETVWNTVSFSRGLHGKPANKGYLMSLLDKLALKDKKDQVVGMVSVNDMDANILVVSENGYGKRSSLEDYRLTNRGGKGVKTISITEKTGELMILEGNSGNRVRASTYEKSNKKISFIGRFNDSDYGTNVDKSLEKAPMPEVEHDDRQSTVYT